MTRLPTWAGRLAIAIALTFTFATGADAQERDWNRSTTWEGFFVVAGGGAAEFDQGGRADMDPAVGTGMRLMFPAGRYFAVGPTLGVRGMRIDDGDRFAVFDAGVAFRVQIPLLRHRGTQVTLLGTVPAGFSVAAADNPDADLGYHLGVLPGVRIAFDQWALLHELGWQRHHLFDDGRHYAMDQLAFHFGVARRF